MKISSVKQAYSGILPASLDHKKGQAIAADPVETRMNRNGR